MKQNKYKYTRKQLFSILSVLLIAVLSLSCEKFLDIRKNSTISLVETAEQCQLILNDYTTMNTNYPSDGEASADDYYLSKNGYLLNTMTVPDQDLYRWSPGAIRPLASPQWQSPYRVVYNANLVLETVEKLKGTVSQEILNDIRGQALFFRAYSFWQLSQLYAEPYVSSTASQKLGIPLRLGSDINIKSERGTLQQTYDRIVEDLSEALGLLNVTSTVASRPNKASAYAMLARTYLSMEDYQQALSNANLALQLNNQLIDYNTISISSNTPFSRFNKEVIFHSLMAPDVALAPGTATSSIAKIDLDLVNSYSSNDLRSKIFIKSNSAPDVGTYRFSGNYEPASSAILFNGLAVDELYLARAECYARMGNISAAMADLNTLLRTRWAMGTYSDMIALTADEALVKVLTERRKELLMRGIRWSDLRRLNRDNRFAKTLSRLANEVAYTLPPNDIRYTLLIPNEVIINSEIPQNPR